MTTSNCKDCGKALTADEARYYGATCEACEGKAFHASRELDERAAPVITSRVEDRDEAIRVWRRHCGPFKSWMGETPASVVIDAMLDFARLTEPASPAQNTTAPAGGSRPAETGVSQSRAVVPDPSLTVGERTDAAAAMSTDLHVAQSQQAEPCYICAALVGQPHKSICSRPDSADHPAVQAEPVAEDVWPEYIASTIVAYLGGGVDDERIKPIAGIIRRRVWLASHPPAQGVGCKASHVCDCQEAGASCQRAQAPAAEPLTDEQMLAMWREAPTATGTEAMKAYMQGIEDAERAHGIGALSNT